VTFSETYSSVGKVEVYVVAYVGGSVEDFDTRENHQENRAMAAEISVKVAGERAVAKSKNYPQKSSKVKMQGKKWEDLCRPGEGARPLRGKKHTRPSRKGRKVPLAIQMGTSNQGSPASTSSEGGGKDPKHRLFHHHVGLGILLDRRIQGPGIPNSRENQKEVVGENILKTAAVSLLGRRSAAPRGVRRCSMETRKKDR